MISGVNFHIRHKLTTATAIVRHPKNKIKKSSHVSTEGVLMYNFIFVMLILQKGDKFASKIFFIYSRLSSSIYYINKTIVHTVKHHITRFEKHDNRINRQRSVFKKLVKAFCLVNRA